MTLSINGKTYDADELIVYHKRLEKENAELKEKYVKNITDCDICDTYCNSQLTKAKELLKQWLQTSNASSCDNINIVTDTEQFLKDNEVEK